MIVLLGSVFMASLLGSLHCAGMCGPFLAFAVSENPSLAPRGLTQLVPQSIYHVARLVVYAALGALFGLVGGALNVGGGFAGLQHVAAWAAGIMLIGISLVTILQSFSWRIPVLRVPAAAQRAISSGMAVAARLRPTARAGLIGALTALLPCGWLYGFVLAAVGTGGALSGAALMLAFWAGTVPMLVGVGLAVQRVGPLLGARVQLVASLALAFVGLLTVTGRLNAFDAIHARAAARAGSLQDVAAEVEQLQATRPACCEQEP